MTDNWFSEVAEKAEARLRAADPDTLGPAARKLLGIQPKLPAWVAETIETERAEWERIWEQEYPLVLGDRTHSLINLNNATGALLGLEALEEALKKRQPE